MVHYLLSQSCDPNQVCSQSIDLRGTQRVRRDTHTLWDLWVWNVISEKLVVGPGQAALLTKPWRIAILNVTLLLLAHGAGDGAECYGSQPNVSSSCAER